jgi:predicted acylesterase/phospholipase RssA
VPTGSLLEDGADITVSVNLMNNETLDVWPDGAEPEPEPERKRRPGMLDTLLDVMDLSQLQTSIRHAELADVTINPQFGPSHWRDFHLADQFLRAGELAAEERMADLRALALPARGGTETDNEGGDVGRADAIRI